MMLALALAAASPAANPLSANPLLGAWRMERLDAVMLATGRIVPNEAVNAADQANGIIIYDPSGWMALEIGAGGRSPDKLGPTGRTRAIETGSYYAYYGRYELDPAKRVVRHRITDSLIPPEIGITAIRHYVVDGDTLTLTSDEVRRPEGPSVNRITFRRLSGSPTTPTTGSN